MDCEFVETGNGGDFVKTVNDLSIIKQKQIWKDVVGYEGIYQVSSIGNIRRVRREVFRSGVKATLKLRRLASRICKNGYVRITLCTGINQKTFIVHRLVAQAFIPNPENKPQVNHKNAIRSDNRVENLEWATSSENIAYKFKIGYRQATGNEDSQSKSISQYDLKGNLIKTFGSIREAERESKIFRAGIGKNLKGAYRQAGGFIWKLN